MKRKIQYTRSHRRIHTFDTVNTLSEGKKKNRTQKK